jgi:glutaredoxin
LFLSKTSQTAALNKDYKHIFFSIDKQFFFLHNGKIMKITVYTISDCQFSKQEKEFLQKNNLPFEEKNLETNKDFLTEMLAVSNNFAGTPVTKIDKDDGTSVVLKGFTQAEFENELNIQPQAPQNPAVDAAPAAAVAPAAITSDQAVTDQTAVADGSAVGDMNQVESSAPPVMDQALPQTPSIDAIKTPDLPPIGQIPGQPATVSVSEPDPVPPAPAAPPVMDQALPQTPSIDAIKTPDLPPIGQIPGQPATVSVSEPAPVPPAPAAPPVGPAAPVMPVAPEPEAPPVVPTTEAQAPVAPAAPQNDQALNDILSSLQARVEDTSVDTAKQQ